MQSYNNLFWAALYSLPLNPKNIRIFSKIFLTTMLENPFVRFSLPGFMELPDHLQTEGYTDNLEPRHILITTSNILTIVFTQYYRVKRFS